MRRFKAGVNFALSAKFMTDLKCGEAQEPTSFRWLAAHHAPVGRRKAIYTNDDSDSL